MKIKISRKLFILASFTLLWMCVIFFFSSQNGDESSGVSKRLLMFICGLFSYSPAADTKELLLLLIRKGAHMTEFGILALLWLATFRSGRVKAAWNYPAAFAASSLYAATDEIHQLFVSERAGQITDWMIDSAGAILFLCIGWLIAKVSEKWGEKEVAGRRLRKKA